MKNQSHYHFSRIIENLLYSHLYTLMQLHKIETAYEMKHLGFKKLYNTDALNDIMTFRDVVNIPGMDFKEATTHFKKSEDVRKELQIIIKTIRDDLL